MECLQVRDCLQLITSTSCHCQKPWFFKELQKRNLAQLWWLCSSVISGLKLNDYYHILDFFFAFIWYPSWCQGHDIDQHRPRCLSRSLKVKVALFGILKWNLPWVTLHYTLQLAVLIIIMSTAATHLDMTLYHIPKVQLWLLDLVTNNGVLCWSISWPWHYDGYRMKAKTIL